jgi:hypothetical protein
MIDMSGGELRTRFGMTSTGCMHLADGALGAADVDRQGVCYTSVRRITSCR